MAVLSVNESLFCIPSNGMGVISVCNNERGNELICFVSRDNYNKTLLSIGDSVCIKMITSEAAELVREFVIPDFSEREKECINDSDIYGIEMRVKNDTICMPFIVGGAVSFLVTMNKGSVTVDAGSITADNLLLDYYNSGINIGDEVRVTLKKLDFVSSPLRERYFSCPTK